MQRERERGETSLIFTFTKQRENVTSALFSLLQSLELHSHPSLVIKEDLRVILETTTKNLNESQKHDKLHFGKEAKEVKSILKKHENHGKNNVCNQSILRNGEIV